MNTAHRYRALGALAAVALAGTGLTACSSGTATETEQARSLLVADVARVQHAVAAHEASRARRAVARLESDVHRLEMNGELSSTAAHAVLAAAVRVRHDLRLLVRVTPATTTTTTTSTSTTTTTTTVPQPGPPGGPPGGGPGKGHGNGNGNGNGDN